MSSNTSPSHIIRRTSNGRLRSGDSFTGSHCGGLSVERRELEKFENL
jgi:hypothetical protein